ncbi:phospholipase-like protein [Tanacetum coccineum]
MSNFMASQDARLSKFEANFKQQQSELTNQINAFLKAINNWMTEALPNDMVMIRRVWNFFGFSLGRFLDENLAGSYCFFSDIEKTSRVLVSLAFQVFSLYSFSGTMKTEKDIKSMTSAEYMEYESRMKKQYVHPTRNEGADFSNIGGDTNSIAEYKSEERKHESNKNTKQTVNEWFKTKIEKNRRTQQKMNQEWVSFVADDDEPDGDIPLRFLPCQLPPKELNPGSFTFPCTVGSLNLYVMADLGASVNIMPKSMFEHLKLANLKETDMLVEMVDMTKNPRLE